MLDSERKQELIGVHQRKQGDTGSCEVQVALLSERVKQLTDHLQKHTKDHASRRGLMLLVSLLWIVRALLLAASGTEA